MKNKKLFAILTLVCFMFTLMPVAAFADDATAVASVGGTEYTDLQTAINAAGENGGTVTLLADITVTGTTFTVSNDATVTLDLNGKTIVGTDTNASDNFELIENKGTLTVKDSTGGGQITLTATTDRNWDKYSAVIANEGGTLTIEGGTLQHLGGTDMAYAIDNNSTLGNTALEIKGGALNSTYIAIRQFANSTTGVNNVLANGGSITASTLAIWVQQPNSNRNLADLTINNGSFTNNSDNYGNLLVGDSEGFSVNVFGGTFSKDPSAYVAAGYEATENNGVWTVAEKAAEKAEVAITTPAVTTTVTSSDQNTQSAIQSVAEALQSTEDNETAPSISTAEMEAAAAVVAAANTVTIAEGVAALEAENITVADETLSIVVQPYMDIKITGIETETVDETTTITELTLNITPMCQTVATTATGNTTIVVKEDENTENANAVKIGDLQTLTINETVTVTVPLPESFVTTEQVYVKHTKVAGNRTINYMYEGKVDENNVLTFVNPHGFSEFTITATAPKAAIDGTNYATLQDALNAANDNDVITINSVDTDEDVVVTVSDTKKVTLKNETEDTITVTINNEPITIAAGKTATFSNKPSTSSGGGFSGSYNYPVNAADVEDATVTFSKNYAVAGDTVTITVTPDAGKQVDEVIVTDADGDVITVTKVGDNQYSFTMPAGKVNVAVTTTDIDYDTKIVLQIGNKNVVTDNKTISNDVAPVIQGDRTLVPIRVIVEALGGSADWNEATRTVTLTIDGKVLTLVIDEEIPGFGQGATIMDSRTYVPIRYVAEYIGAHVDWIAATQQIVILK